MDDLLRCSATVGNLGERGARHPYLGKALGSFTCAKDMAKHESELYGYSVGQESNREPLAF